jgi:hypothetical protein
MFGITRAPEPRTDTAVVGALGVLQGNIYSTFSLIESSGGDVWYQIETQ